MSFFMDYKNAQVTGSWRDVFALELDDGVVDVDLKWRPGVRAVELSLEQFRNECYTFETACARGESDAIYRFFENFVKSREMLKIPEYAKCVKEIELPALIQRQIAVTEEEKAEFDDSDKSLVNFALDSALICVNTSESLARLVVRRGVPVQILVSFDLYDEDTQANALMVLESILAHPSNLGQLAFAENVLKLAIKGLERDKEKGDLQELYLRLMFHIMRHKNITREGLRALSLDEPLIDKEKEVKACVLNAVLNIFTDLPSDEMRYLALGTMYNICLRCPEFCVAYRDAIMGNVRSSIEHCHADTTSSGIYVVYYGLKILQFAFTNVPDAEFQHYVMDSMPAALTLLRLSDTTRSQLIQEETFKIFIRMVDRQPERSLAVFESINLFGECQDLMDSTAFDTKQYISVFLAVCASHMPPEAASDLFHTFNLCAECVDLIDAIDSSWPYLTILHQALLINMERNPEIGAQFAAAGLAEMLTSSQDPVTSQILQKLAQL